MNHALIFNVHNLGHRRTPGPHRIATVLRNEGWDIEVIDFASMWPLDKLQELTRLRITQGTAFFGFGVMFDMWGASNMEEFSAWLKQEYPHIKQVIGGQWPPVHDSNHIDYYITGYAENAMLQLSKVLTKEQPISAIAFDPKYLGSKKKVISGNKFYPSFPMKSLTIRYEERDYIMSTEWLTIEAGRGCKFQCPYCTYPILGVKEDYSRDAADFAEQLQDTYDRFGVTNYFVADETFNDATEKIIKFADAVSTLTFKPWFTGFIRADLLVSRRQDWEPLHRMGFYGHFYGIETMNHATAKSIKKGMKPEKLLAGLLEVKDYFKNTGDGLYRGLIAQVVGLPHETKDTLAKAFKWLEDNWQGEAINLTALDIPLDDTVDVLSEMSINWEAFGYTKVSDTVPQLDLKNFIVGQTIMNSKLHWKNEHMDYVEASKIADDFKCSAEDRELFGVNPWGLDYFTHYMPLDRALTMRQRRSTKESFDSHVANTQVNVNEYIAKKLS